MGKYPKAFFDIVKVTAETGFTLAKRGIETAQTETLKGLERIEKIIDEDVCSKDKNGTVVVVETEETGLPYESIGEKPDAESQ